MIGKLLLLFFVAAQISTVSIAAGDVKHHHPHHNPQPNLYVPPKPQSHPHPNPGHHVSKPQPGHSHSHGHSHGHSHSHGHTHSHCKELKGWWESESHLIIYILEDVPRSYVVTFDGFFFKSEDRRVAATIMGARTKLTSNRDDGTFGFVVTFPAGGTAVWVGQCYNEHGKDFLQSLMLHHSFANPNEYWLATRVASQVWKRLPGPPSWYNPSASFPPK